MSDYTPPKVWTWNKANGGRFANINRPIAGPTHDKELPVGRHPLQLYSLATPNGVKVTVMLEELLALGHSGAEYDAWLIKIGDGDQFGSGFVAINPNSKIPALLDRSGPKPIRVFESGAILLHLAEKFGAFLPTEPAARAECLSWLFWQMGSAPYLGGGFGHFYAYAPTKIEYAIDRFAMEVKRQLDVLDRRLAETEYLAGDDYTIADIAVWPWYGGLAKGLLYGAASSSRCTNTRTSSAGPMPSVSARPSSAAAWSTACRASRRPSCTSATTPAISKRRRRTSWPPAARRALVHRTTNACRQGEKRKSGAHSTFAVSSCREDTLVARSRPKHPCGRVNWPTKSSASGCNPTALSVGFHPRVARSRPKHPCGRVNRPTKLSASGCNPTALSVGLRPLGFDGAACPRHQNSTAALKPNTAALRILDCAFGRTRIGTPAGNRRRDRRGYCSWPPAPSRASARRSRRCSTAGPIQLLACTSPSVPLMVL